MARATFGLYSAGMAEMLKSADVAAAVQAAADAVAENVRNDSNMIRNEIADEVSVDDYVTDRAASSVTITHPAGIGMEGKHGVLSNAARAAGLEVNAK